ncbi:MAG: polysaccharide biosynthesis/export family protein [Phycisphaerales bacterium]|nr:polysaccharide biosynthesis/export family protein [Phycisphaerales bacterium]
MRRRFKQTALSAGCLAALGAGTGCALNPLNGFLDPTKVGMFPAEFREGGIRRVLTPRESPMGIAGATEPTPADLVPEYVEYRLGPQDQLQVTIDDFITQGIPLAAQFEVNPSGFIRIPQLGSIKVTGMTEEEFEADIRNRVIQGGFLTDPIVTASIVVRRQLTFSMLGAVRSAGTYPIAFSDFRVLDALGFGGDIGAGIRKLYVIRRGADGGSAASNVSADGAAAPPQSQPAPAEREFVIPPPDEPIAPAMLSAWSGGGQETPADAPQTAPSQTDDRRALEEIMSEQDPTTRGSTARSQPATATSGERSFAPLVFDPVTGELKEAPPRAAEPLDGPAAQTPLPDAAAQPFRWDDETGDELSQRVIEIDVDALRAGDPRQNIVIRNRDTIMIPIDTGVFYVQGEVARPGVFGFNEREITLKQAMAIVGGFAPLAWPQRCEIIRREKGTDKQITVSVNLDAIFAGLEDDILLKDNDIVNVGSNIVAPFLFVIRNSFRFTYGFGFVYDRNFADQDSYAGRANPEALEQARRANRGLPF